MTNISGTLKSIRDIMWQDTGLNGDAQRIEQLGWMLFLKIFSDKDVEMEVLYGKKYKSPIPKQFQWIKQKGDNQSWNIYRKMILLSEKEFYIFWTATQDILAYPVSFWRWDQI